MELTEQCDWNGLMSVLVTGEQDFDEQREDVFTFIKKVIGHNSTGVTLDIITSWYIRSMNLNGKNTVNYFKRLLTKSDLSTRAREIYEHILLQCPTDESMLAVKKMIDEGPSLSKKVSGRTIDTLVTRFPRYYNVCYYIDVTDINNTMIVENVDNPDRKIMLFDVGSSYRKKMHQYSKTYFDCFGRGDEVEHILNNGEVINITICQFTFFIWASRFKVFEFLKNQFERVIVVRQQSQKNTYQPKLKKKRKTKRPKPIITDIKKSVLCPKITHAKKRKRISEKVVMASSTYEFKRDMSVYVSKPLFRPNYFN